MKRSERIFWLLLAALLLLSGCGAGEVDTGADTTVAVDTTTETVEETIAEPELPYTTFDGQALRLLYANDDGVPYSVKDLWTDGLTGEVVNDAVYHRNVALEEKFDIVLQADVQNQRYAVREKAKKEITGGISSFDLMFEECNQAYPMALEGMFYNWLELPHIDMDADYWDSNARDGLSLRGKLYPMVSDISMIPSAQARYLYINKTMAARYGLTIPYDDVRDGTWTMDKFIDMVVAVSEDLNGDGVMDSYDQFGMLTENPEFFIVGCGVVLAEKNDQDEPEFCFVSERTVSVLEKVQTLLNDKDHTLSFDDTAKGRDISGFNHIFDYGRSRFAAGQFLFVQNGAGISYQFTDMEDEYGMLPNPKLDEEQESYYHLMDAFAPMMFLPATLEDPEMLGLCLEYWSWLSSTSVKEAYYETTMKKKRVNAPDDAEMLDIVRNSCQYEITYIYDTGALGILRNAASKGNLMSSWASQEKAVNTKLQKLLDTVG